MLPRTDLLLYDNIRVGNQHIGVRGQCYVRESFIMHRDDYDYENDEENEDDDEDVPSSLLST